MRVPVALFGWIEVPESNDDGEIVRLCAQALARLGAELDVVGWEVIKEAGD